MKKSILFIFLFLLAYNLYAQPASTTRDKPFVLGRVHEMYSTILLEKRILNIYLPDDYNEKDSVRYPVIYLLDGSADEDFIHITGLVQFLTFPWVNSMPKSIVVGIANVDRRRDFTFPTTIEKDRKDFPTTGHSEKFILYLEKELQPFIEKNYKTTSSKTIIGQSLGGLLATEVLFKKPELFNQYIIISPSLWWDNESLLAITPKVLAPSFNTPVSIYIATGKEGKIMEGDAKKLVSILNKGKGNRIKVNHELFTNENHASILHNAAYHALEVINRLPGKKTNQ